MISITTIILFFIYTWGLGFTATYWLKQSDNFWERLFINIGLGLGVFAILSVILNFAHIPLDWKIFLVLSIILPIYDLSKKIKNKQMRMPEPKVTRSTLTLLFTVFIAMISLYIYASGAFSYPYLEDEDPWGHAVGVDYVSIEKNAYDPPLVGYWDVDPALSYIDPYPPAYDILLGILHQTSPDIMWTMKFFNALLISLGIVFFYIFAREFIGDRNKALFATFVLAAIPSYLTHFIWAHALAITLICPTMYAFERIKSDWKWSFTAAIMVGAIWVAQNFEQPVKITTMILIYIVVSSITLRKIKKAEMMAVIGGLLLSMFYFGGVILRKGLKNFLGYYAVVPETTFASFTGAAQGPSKPVILKIFNALFDYGGSASRAYTFSDFFFAKSDNLINNSIGIGIVISILAMIGVVYVLVKYRASIVKSENTWLAVTLFWLIFTFWGVNGAAFPISVARGAFRTWMLMAIPISLITAEGLYALKKLSSSKAVWLSILIIAIGGIVLTSAQQKYQLNTSTWPTSSAFAGSPSEAFEFASLFNSIPNGEKVFLYVNRPKIATGFGKGGCNWCQNELDFRKGIINRSADEIHDFLSTADYDYLLLSPSMDFRQFSKEIGQEKAQEMLNQRYNEITKSGLFVPVQQKENLYIFLRVK